jgi:hypothetical protein
MADRAFPAVVSVFAYLQNLGVTVNLPDFDFHGIFGRSFSLERSFSISPFSRFRRCFDFGYFNGIGAIRNAASAMHGSFPHACELLKPLSLIYRSTCSFRVVLRANSSRDKLHHRVTGNYKTIEVFAQEMQRPENLWVTRTSKQEFFMTATQGSEKTSSDSANP